MADEPNAEVVGGTVSMSSILTGVISAFSDETALGEVTDSEGRAYPFHAVGLADGSRSVAAGSHVAFRAAAGHRGKWEGIDIVTL